MSVRRGDEWVREAGEGTSFAAEDEDRVLDV